MIDVALRILADAGRSLSARKILQAGEQDALFDDVPTLTDLKAALKAAAEAGDGIRQVRRGVYAVDDGSSAPAKASPKPKAKAKPKAEEPAEGDTRRRRRRQKPSDLVGETPGTALSVEEAVAEAEASDDAATLRANIWKKMRNRAAEVAGVPLQESAPAPEEAPRPAGLRGVIAARLKAKLAAEDAAWTPPPAPEPVELLEAAERLVEDDAEADLKARLAARWKANPLEAVPVVRTPAKPKKAKKAKKADKPKKADKADKPKKAAKADKPKAKSAPPARAAAPSEAPRPAPRRAERATPAAEIAEVLSAAKTAPETPDLAGQAYDALLDADVPLNGEALSERLEVSAGALRAAILAANASADADGRRAPFAISIDGRLGLTAWSLSRRYQELESRIEAALREQADLVRTDILERVTALSDAGFERVVAMLLERQGFNKVKVMQRNGSTIALQGRRNGDRAAIVAHRTGARLSAATVDAVRDSLPELKAAAGVVLTTGGFDASARDAARRTEVRLIDGPAFARALYAHGVGLASHRPVMAYMDGAFFAGLAKA